VYLEEVMDVLMPATEAVQEPKETEDSDPSIGPEQAATIERLLKQRRDTLRQVVELANAEYGAGRATQTDVVHATESLIEAELELTTDKAERIALREKRVESLRNLEQYTRAKQLVAVATSAELLAATAARLKAEIELLRERASDS
jgi:outer membrane protein TolC